MKNKQNFLYETKVFVDVFSKKHFLRFKIKQKT